MKNLLHPRWLFLINSLPIAVFLILSGFQLNIVHSLLDTEDFTIWGVSIGILVVISGTIFAYATRATYKNEDISSRYAIGTLIVHVLYAVFYMLFLDDILWQLPTWMISPDFHLYVITFLMPTVIHALFVLVLSLTWERFENGWLNLFSALGIPFLIYVFSQVFLPFWDGPDSEIAELGWIILLCFLGLTFLFFVIRGTYFIINKKKKRNPIAALIWKILVALVFPISGLMLNQGVMFGRNFFSVNEGIFGNFGSIGFYIFAIVNGIFVCLPERENPTYRLIVFGLRMLTFTYVVYFFLVFLPYLPLSVFAILIFALGLLMLTPLILFIMQSRLLVSDFEYLKNFYSKDKLRAIAVITFLAIPIGITFNYLNDKKVLNETLDYIYYPDFSKKYDLNESAVKRILSNVKVHKKGTNDFFSNHSHTPFLSSFYTWLVLDNMTLSDSKINKIENVFMGESSTRRRRGGRRAPINGTIEITDIQTKSEYDAKQDAWLTWVDFEMTNLDTTNNGQREYDVAFNLPAGCYVSDYYLDIEGKREQGILAEKRAAVWIYQQITNTNRDPGLLNYIGADKVRFRVFPFTKSEVRTTGIQFIHKEPVTINIDNKEIQLGDVGQQELITTATDLTENVTYVSASAKSKLPKVKRQPYYHFIVDASVGMENGLDNNISNIDNFIKKQGVDLTKAAFSFTNKYTTITTGKDWKTNFKNQTFEGGFYLERGIEKALFDAYENRKNEYPIIVIVSANNLARFILEDDFSNFKMIYPESNYYYKIENDSILARFDLTKNAKIPLDSITSISATPMVLAYPNAKNPIAYLEDNNTASIVLKSGIIKNKLEKVTEKNWQSALTMSGNWLSQNLHPETAEDQYYELVKSSFKSGVMNPTTSFISLENEAQKQMLKKKQKEVLLGNKALDLSEQPDQMSEPELWIVLILFGLFAWFRKRKNAKLLA